MQHRIRIVRAAVAIFAFLVGQTRGASAASPRGIPQAAERTTVRTVVNGDPRRITLDGGEKATAQLLGADAPDPASDDAAASCYGDEATARPRSC